MSKEDKRFLIVITIILIIGVTFTAFSFRKNHRQTKTDISNLEKAISADVTVGEDEESAETVRKRIDEKTGTALLINWFLLFSTAALIIAFLRIYCIADYRNTAGGAKEVLAKELIKAIRNNEYTLFYALLLENTFSPETLVEAVKTIADEHLSSLIACFIENSAFDINAEIPLEYSSKDDSQGTILHYFANIPIESDGLYTAFINELIKLGVKVGAKDDEHKQTALEIFEARPEESENQISHKGIMAVIKLLTPTPAEIEEATAAENAEAKQSTPEQTKTEE